MNPFLARCATCMLAIHEPTFTCPKCKSPRLVLVTGAWPERPRSVATIPLEPAAVKNRRAKESDEAYLARRTAEHERKEAARKERAFLRLVSQHAKLERRVFALDVGRRHREAVTREQRRARRERAKAERRHQAAAERERVAESKRLAIEERRRSAHEKWAQERREMAIRAQVRLEAKAFRSDQKWQEKKESRRRAEKERLLQRPALERALVPWLAEGTSAAGSRADDAPLIEARPDTLFGSLIARFGEQFPDFMARDGHRLAVPLPEFTAWLAAGGGR